MTLAASIASAIGYIAQMAQWFAIFGGRDENGERMNSCSINCYNSACSIGSNADSVRTFPFQRIYG